MSKKKKISGLEKLVVDFLKQHQNSKITTKAIETALQLDKKNDKKRLRKTINKLVSKKRIKRSQGNLLSVVRRGNNHKPHQGKLSLNRYGVGFVPVEDYEEDIRIPSKYLGTALPDDIVNIEIFRGGRRKRIEGKIIEVVERGRDFYVGTLIKQGKDTYYIETDERSAQTDFFVLPQNINGAKNNDKVIFSLIEWAHPKALPEAKVIDTLGEKGTNDALVLSILAENQMRAAFPEDVVSFADNIPKKIPDSEIERRNDLRSEVIFTIDPEDAKDFDDAISFDQLQNGNFKIGVHIADVSYYMQSDTVLDKEAYKRGTSVYLVDRVIPMLPEELSNGVCSLRPNEDKLTYSCFMEVTSQGRVVDYSIEETVINSKFRFTYEQAQKVIDGELQNPYEDKLKKLAQLSQTLIKNRFKAGSIDFDTPEPRFVLDDDGTPIKVIIKERLLTHRLIEECMLLANKTVAIHVDNLRQESGKKKTKDLYPFFYRIHDKPDDEKLANIAEHVKPIGIDFDIKDGNVTPQKINKLLEEVQDTSLEYIINNLVLRAMSKAEYGPKNIGHFGLNFSHYTHFTSPIRRYPDVIVHRLLKNYEVRRPAYRFDDLKKFGNQCSEREKMAVDAERDSVKLKQVEYLSKRIGEEYIGVISGVTENGIYVDLKDIHCEGMVHISNMNDDYYIYDRKRYCLYGRSRGRKYQMGNLVKVRVEDTNLEQRTVDLVLIS
ncbi:MAG TPA: ribonuclease R [Balneolales bacterium]|nr:ribonuclease R [Balneolales bacterium]